MSDNLLSASALNACAGRSVALLRGLAKGSGRLRAEVVDAWVGLLAPAIARLRREAVQIALIGHQHGDLARAAAVIYEAELLPDDADEAPGRLLRIVWTDGEPELEEHTPNGSPWHWSTAHPDPVPPMMAQATGLQAERAALTREDQDTSTESAKLARRVNRLQQDVLSLSSAVHEARTAERESAQALAAEETRLARILSQRDAVKARLPVALQQEVPTGSIRAIQAAVQAPFHPNTLDELAREDEAVERARAAVAHVQAIWESADARHRDAQARLQAHDQHLREARSALSTAQTRRVTLRDRADALSRKRLALAQQMDHAAEARRNTLADDLAARLHGDSTSRLRLRWPHAGLGSDTICLMAPGTLAPDPSTRRLAEDMLTQRADALVLGARLDTPPAADRVQALRRMSRTCPRIALLFHDLVPGDEASRLSARNAWAGALQVAPERVLAVALPGDAMTSTQRTDEAPLRAGRRERAALVEALRTGPPIARAAGIARAIRSAAGRVDAEHRRLEHGHATQLALLEAQRIDDIPAFVADRREAIARHVAPAAHRAREAVSRAVSDHLSQTRALLAGELHGAPDVATLDLLREQLPERLVHALEDGRHLARRAVRRAEARAVEELIDAALTPLSERVRLSAQATRPPDHPPSLSADEDSAQKAILDKLRDVLDDDQTSTTPAALAGGAIGAALLGPVGALLGAGAGVLASKVGGGLPKRRQAAIELLDKALVELEADAQRRALTRLEGCELRVGTRVDTQLPPTLTRYVAWWTEQRAELGRQGVRLQQPLGRLQQVRDRLMASVIELEEAIASESATSGVVTAPAYAASLPPPPPPIV